MTRKQRVQPPSFAHVDEKTKSSGWIRDLMIGTETLLWGRWSYWLNICARLDIGTAEENPIPQIPWLSSWSNDCPNWPNPAGIPAEIFAGLGSPVSAAKETLRTFERAYCVGASLTDLIDWWLWAFGSRSIARRPNIPERAAVLMYHELNLDKLVAHPLDWGEVLARDYYSKSSKQRSGWFATPMELTRAMVEMQFANDPRDTRPLSVNDPCVGTGVMLLAASNYSLNLTGQDIDMTMVRLCEFNAWLHVPWMVFGRKEIIRGLKSKERQDNPEAGEYPIESGSKVQRKLFGD